MADVITITDTEVTATFEIRREHLIQILIDRGIMPADAKLVSIVLHNDDPWKSDGPNKCDPADAIRIKARWSK